MPRLELFPFRYREQFSGKWVKARYRAERHEIAGRYSEWEIVGPPEIRDVDPNARYFSPWKVVPHADLMRMQELPPELQPHLASHRRWTTSKRSSQPCSCAATSRTAPGADNTHG